MRTQRGFDRMVAFSDAVVAIALTLLVLQLVDIPGEAPGAGISVLLREHLGQFGAFFLSFAVIARFWVAHHTLFERVGAYDGVLRWLTLAWLLSVVFLPFPTELVSVGYSRGDTALYIGTLLVTSLSLAAAGAWVNAHPPLQRNDDDDGRLHPRRPTSWVTSGLILVALVIDVTVPAIGMWALLALLLSGPLEAGVSRRAPRKASRTGTE